MRLLGRICGIVGTLGQALSKTQARLHFPRVTSPRSRFIVAGIMVCGAVVLLAVGVFGVLKAELDDDDSLPTGDLGAIVTPAGHDEPTPAATITPAGHDEPTPPATITPLPEVATPARMVIEKMGMDAPIITLGLDANRLPEVPDDPDVVAWYDFSTKPGQGSNAVFGGHVDWTVNGQPVTAVFWGLGELEEGDVVKILLKDDSELQYRVTDNVALGYDDPEGVKVMYRTPNDVITLISCGGTWVSDPSNPLGGNYTHRVVVRAKRVT
jgi:LPXTG-site transpeptidase (sortase) family protein